MRPAILLWILYGSLGCPDTCLGYGTSAKPSQEAAFFPTDNQPLSRPWFQRSALPVRGPDLQASAHKSLLFGPRRHRFMHFGKRENLPPFPFDLFVPDSQELDDLNGEGNFVLPRPDDEGSYQTDDYQDVAPGLDKRGGGSSGPSGSNKFIHFGKRTLYELSDQIGSRTKRSTAELRTQEQDSDEVDAIKRAANRYMHFGKREGVDVPYKRARNRMMHFGKREDEDWLEDEEEKRASNRMLHFGKRAPSTDDYYYKRNPNKMMHFGKRTPRDEEDLYKRAAAHRIMHFGKRLPPVEDLSKRARNRIMHFGKRTALEDELAKRAANRMMHFGKRSPTDDDGEKRAAHRIMHFGKRTQPLDYDKRARNRMMHFGKRTTDVDANKRVPNGKRQEDDSREVRDVVLGSSGLAVDEGQEDLREGQRQDGHERTKRSAADGDYNEDDDTLQRVVSQLITAGYDKRHPGLLAAPGPLQIPHAYMAAHVYRSAIPRMLSRPSRSDRYFPALLGHETTEPRAQTRNVFLRFG